MTRGVVSAARPVAYLRRSKVDAGNAGAISHADQVERVTVLAGPDAERLLWLEDWGRSGQAKGQHKRADYAELRRMVAAGEVSAVYTWTLSRLARSLTELNDLAHLCADHAVPIKCADGFSPDISTATGRLVLSLLGAVHQYQAEWTAEAAAGAIAVRRSRGDRLGRVPYGEMPSESVQGIVDAFHQAGSFLGACKLLNAAGVPSRLGGPWHPLTVARILRRPRAELQARCAGRVLTA